MEPRRSVIFSGPSEVGKTTFCRRLASDFGYLFPQPLTTNPKHRLVAFSGHTEEYVVVSDEQMSEILRHQSLITESALGFVYGSPMHFPSLFTRSSRVCLHALTSIAVRLRDSAPHPPVLVFLAHPSDDVFRSRLAAKYPSDSFEYKARFEHAVHEVSARACFDHTVIVDDYADAFHQICEILL